MLSFNTFVLVSLALRIIFIIYGTIVSIRIIGLESIPFLLRYIRIRALTSHKLVMWIIAFGTLSYFEHLVSDLKDVSIFEVLDKHMWLGLYIFILLVSVNAYTFIDIKNSVQVAKDTKEQFKYIKIWKNLSSFVKEKSEYAPGGFLILIVTAKIDTYIDDHIENRVTKVILNNISIMMILAIINMSIVLISIYLITDLN